MKRFGVLCTAALMVAILAGCNTYGRQPRVRQALIEPAELHPGDTALISVQIEDRFGIVKRVEGVVREDPRITFQLRDDGVEPDLKAGDGIWILPVDVPFQAPPGKFTLDVTAYRSDGEAIVVRDEKENAVVLGSSFEMLILFPAPPEAAAQDTEPEK
jgi:hypothetical protein